MDIQLSIMILLVSIIVGLSVYVLFLHKLLKRTGMELLQAISDRKVVVDYLEEEMAKNNTLQLNDDDGFVKFLSQSRDWAFKYIEDVQDELQKFADVVGPVMEYYSKYGRVVETIHTPSLEKIYEAYNELIKMLPETENNKENNE